MGMMTPIKQIVIEYFEPAKHWWFWVLTIIITTIAMIYFEK
jgi:hypothetical protein